MTTPVKTWKHSTYAEDDLKKVTELLASKLNILQPASQQNGSLTEKKKNLFNEASSSYRNLSASYPLLSYSFPSVKPSVYSYLGNYLGFTGYYNPFTGEAQVNTTIPPICASFLLPVMR